MLTHHAHVRAAQRGISLHEIELVLAHGTCLHQRGADHYIMGWREVASGARQGLDLKELEGYRVVCTPTGEVLTVYRQARPRHRRTAPDQGRRHRTSFKAGSDALLKRLESVV